MASFADLLADLEKAVATADQTQQDLSAAQQALNDATKAHDVALGKVADLQDAASSHVAALLPRASRIRTA